MGLYRMKKIIGTVLLVFGIFIIGNTQHDEHHPVEIPKTQDSTLLDSLVLQDTTKKEIKEILTDFYSTSDSGKLNLAIINVPAQTIEKKGEESSGIVLQKQFTWWQFFLLTTFLILLYFILQFFSGILEKFKLFGKYQNSIKSIVSYSLLTYEALVILILGCAFVLINPIYHGILILFLLLVGFSHVKNYFSGRVVQFDQSLEDGKRLKMLDSQGVIFKKGRLGLKLRTTKGVQFINYSSLIANGYTLLSGEEVGVFYELKIQPNTVNEKRNYLVHLNDLLTTTPYLDFRNKPYLEILDDELKTILARVEVKEESHLHDLITMMKERDYSIQVNG